LASSALTAASAGVANAAEIASAITDTDALILMISPLQK
jgi:hypothetical protein